MVVVVCLKSPGITPEGLAPAAAEGDREHVDVAINKEGSRAENGEDGGNRKGFCFHSLMKNLISRFMGY